MNDFYVINLKHKSGAEGWVINDPSGITLASEYIARVTQFDSWESANMFVKTHNFNRQDIIVKIYSNTEIMEMQILGIKPLAGSLYYLENDKGEKCCYSEMHQDKYYFKRCDAGFAVWEDPSQITPLRDYFVTNHLHCDVKEIKK